MVGKRPDDMAEKPNVKSLGLSLCEAATTVLDHLRSDYYQGEK